MCRSLARIQQASRDRPPACSQGGPLHSAGAGCHCCTASPHHSPGRGLCPNMLRVHPCRASRSSLAPQLWQQCMPWLGRSLFHLAWLGETLSPSKIPSAAPLWPPRQPQIPPSPSELASWEPSARWWEVPFGISPLGQNLWASQAFLWSILDVGNPRGALGCRELNLC